MAVPIGTTSRQLEFVIRWLLAGVVTTGMLAWWWPSYWSWGALTGSALVIWTLWAMLQIHRGVRSVPGHPVHAVLLGPLAVLTWHLARTGLGTQASEPLSLAGAMNMSMLFQFALLAGLVMLSQSLLPRAAGHVGVISACGLAMAAGATTAVLRSPAAVQDSCLAMLSMGGLAVWLTPLWGVVADDVQTHPLHLPDKRPGRAALRVLHLAVAVAVAAVIAWRRPAEATAALGIVGVVVFLGGLVFPRKRLVLVLSGGLATTAAVLAGRFAGASAMTLNWLPTSLLGRGEDAYRDVYAGDSGLAVLAGVIGWAGLLWLLVGLMACTVWLLFHARRGYAGDQGRAIAWTAAAALVSTAMLAPGGLFVPAISLAAGLTWGLMPTMLGRPANTRHGVFVLAAALLLLILLGLTKNDGLVQWMATTYGQSDKVLHGMTGFVVATAMAWQMGAKRIWLGLIGIAIAAAVGAGGEITQDLASTRNPELADWLAHVIGAAAAVPLYLLAVASRWCESRDATGGTGWTGGTRSVASLISSHDAYR